MCERVSRAVNSVAGQILLAVVALVAPAVLLLWLPSIIDVPRTYWAALPVTWSALVMFFCVAILGPVSCSGPRAA